MTLADMLDGYEAGRVTRLRAMRWCDCYRHAEFLAILDYNLRRLPRGRLPLRPLRQQLMRRRMARRRPDFERPGPRPQRYQIKIHPSAS